LPALIAQQRAGLIGVHAATARRKELRRGLQFQLLRYLIRVGEAAAKVKPKLAMRFHLAGILDGLNRDRFRNDSEFMAAWECARRVTEPFRSKGEEPAVGCDEVLPRLGGDVASAARRAYHQLLRPD